MGIRIHKMLGYGLTDVATDDHGRVTDPRLNGSSPFLTRDTGPEHSVEAYLDYLTETDPVVDDAAPSADRIQARRASTGLERLTIRDGLTNGRRTTYQPEYSVVHRSEYGLANVLCVKPVSQAKWSRTDDMIDWVTDTYLLADTKPAGSNGEDHVRVLTDGFYPWSGLYMDDRTGDRADDTILWWVRERNRLANLDDAADKPFGFGDLDDLAADGGFADHADALAHCHPWIPTEIRRLCTFAQLFTDPAGVNQLRPMIYTYWG